MFDYLSIGHLVKLDKKLTTLVKMANDTQSNGISSQVKKKPMTLLIKMANGI
jgi:hypothetical protein